MIEVKQLEKVINKKSYENVLWEYDSELIQLIKNSTNEIGKQIFNFTITNLKSKNSLMIVLGEKEFIGYCDCDLGKQGKKCEHLIWAGIKINEILEKKEKTKEIENSDEHIINLLTNINGFQNLEDKISLKFEIIKYDETQVELNWMVTCNKQKIYKINNMEKFINQVNKKLPLNYGKFLKTDNYKLTSNSEETLFLIISFANNREQEYNKLEKYNTLTIEEFEKLIKAYVNKYIKYKNEDFLITENLKDISMKIEKNNEEIDLTFNNTNKYKFLTKTLVINKEQKMFYLLSNFEQNKINLLETIINNDEKENIKMPLTQGMNFVNKVLPKIYNEFDITVDSEFKIDIVIEKLKIELRCYLENRQIKIKPYFNYGKYNSEDVILNKIIKRNTYQENKVIKNLLDQGYNYDSTKKEFFIDVEKSQFLFLTKNIFEFKEEYDVQIDEKLKKAILKFDSSSIKIDIKQKNELDYFDFSFSLDSIKTKEIDEIIKSFEAKKQFHRLEDDSFIKLNDQKIYEQLLFLQEVIKNNTTKLGSYRIPKYKALLLSREVKSKFNKVITNQEFENYLEEIQLIKDVSPGKFKNKHYGLRKYQEIGVSWLNTLYDAKFGALLADEMGLGKTIQIISFLEIAKINKGLIVVPKSLLYNWKKEFQKFNPLQKITLIEGTKEKRKQLIEDNQGDSFLIISYNSLQKDYDDLKKLVFPIMIIDEAQYIKNPQTKVAKSVKMIKANFFVALTGTPIENNILELWSIFDYLLPDYLNTMEEFNKKYKNKHNKIKNIEILKEGISPFLLRRLKKDVLQELPDKIEIDTYCELEEEQAKIYLAMTKKIKKDIQKISGSNEKKNKSMEILAAITRLRQIAIDPELYDAKYANSSGKLEVFNELIEEIIDSGEKVLVFSQYTKMLKKLAKNLDSKDYKYYYLDGETKPKNRLIEVEKFNKNKIPIYLISLKAGGVGINLTSATNIIIYDPWWNPAIENQAIDRSHRIGQKKKVNVYRLISSGTIEESISQLKKDKQKVVNEVLNEQSEDLAHINKMTTEELTNLLIN